MILIIEDLVTRSEWRIIKVNGFLMIYSFKNVLKTEHDVFKDLIILKFVLLTLLFTNEKYNMFIISNFFLIYFAIYRLKIDFLFQIPMVLKARFSF